MKNNPKDLQSIKGSGMDLPSKPLPPGTLYVVCLNKPLIDLWAMSDRNMYDTPVTKRSSAHTSLNSHLQSDDKIPVMLSPEEEMLLYNEGLTDWY